MKHTRISILWLVGHLLRGHPFINYESSGRGAVNVGMGLLLLDFTNLCYGVSPSC